MKVRTKVQAGGLVLSNHNQGVGLKCKARVKAGLIGINHNENAQRLGPSGGKVDRLPSARRDG